MNTVQNNRIRNNLTRSIVIATFSHFLNVFLDVILNNFDPLYNNIFKNPLALLQIELGLIRVFIESRVELLLKLEIHFIFPVNNTINISEARSWSQRMSTFINWSISKLIDSTTSFWSRKRVIIHYVSARWLRCLRVDEIIVLGLSFLQIIIWWWNTFAGQIVLGRGSGPVMRIQINVILTTTKNVAYWLLVNKRRIIKLWLPELWCIHIVCKSMGLRHIIPLSHRIISIIRRLGKAHVLEQTLWTYLVQHHGLFIWILSVNALLHIKIVLSFLHDCL